MGYTHYWRTDGSELDQDKFVQLKNDAVKIVHEAVEAGIDIEEAYETDAFYINGTKENAHEDFVFTRIPDEFNFCKTNGKPYDMVVVAILIQAKKIFGDEIRLKSDGNWDDWEGGRFLYETTFGVEPKQEEVFA